MSTQDYSIAFTVDQSPEKVFAAINNVRGWWSEEIEGDTDRLGAQFTFHYQSLHRTTQKITDLVPGERVVWRIVKSHIGFVQDKDEWLNTEVVFEIRRKGRKTELRFTHVGLAPEIECYGGCSGAWRFYVKESLRDLVTTGRGQPNKAADAA